MPFCTIISLRRKKRAAGKSSANANTYIEQFQDEYGVGKGRIGQNGNGVEGQATAKLREYEANFIDEYGVGKERLPGAAVTTSTNGNRQQKVDEGTVQYIPLVKFAF